MINAVLFIETWEDDYDRILRVSMHEIDVLIY